MCGIAGILSSCEADNQNVVADMANTLLHRGPDAGETWVDASAGIAISHRRLSILDLSPQGAQPMVSPDGRYIISYNGEIYNHIELRRNIEKHISCQWRGHSDTEVLLASIETWGIEKTLKLANGMFAFALWDRESRTLTLARDRIGEKPLYLGWIGNQIAFASELKALRQVPGWEGKINRLAVGYLLRFGFVPAPLSIYQGIYKLPQAHYIQLTQSDTDTIPSAEIFQDRCTCYWNLSEIVLSGINNPLAIDETAAINELDELLSESIRLRMVADVPVGALLSGGIDSSLVTAIMQHNSAHPIRTFTIGFEDSLYDEAKFSRPVAMHLGCDHTAVTLCPQDALKIIPNLHDIYNEPFADPSQIPTILVAAIARREVTVGLSGDGGDELFGGYARYRIGKNIWSALRWVPPSVRITTGKWLTKSIGEKRLFPCANRTKQLAFKFWRLGKRISVNNFESYYANLLALSLCQVTPPDDWPVSLPILHRKNFAPNGLDIDQHMMYVDQVSYLPDNILVKSDRASMAASLELRIPLLDHRIVEFSWRMPAHLRRDEKGGKSLLRQLLYRYVPKELIDRPKKGFDIPIDDWLRGPLREWLQDLLSLNVIRGSEYLNSKMVRFLVNEHLSGHGNHGYSLWPILMFQSWLTRQSSP